MSFNPLSALASIAGGVGGFFVGGPMGAAIGSGLATTLATGNIGQGLISGLLGYGLGGAAGAIGSFGTDAAAQLGGEAAKEALKNQAATAATETAGSGLGGSVQGAIAGNIPSVPTQIATGVDVGQVGGAALNAPAGSAQSFLTASNAPDYLKIAQNIPNNITNPDALKAAFWSNPSKTTFPIASGLASFAMQPGSSGSAKPYTPYTPMPNAVNYGTGRRYVPRQPDPYGRENNYFQYAEGGWIQGAIKHPGALHRQLGVPEGEKIPRSKLDAAANSSNPTLARRARLAKTLSKFDGGGYVSGPGGGLDDAIPAIIDGRAPAKLSSGEYVVPAHAVSALGDGSTEAGVKMLDGMVDDVMMHKYGTEDRKPNPMGGAPEQQPFRVKGYDSGGGVMDWLFGGGKEKPERSWDMPTVPQSWPTKQDVEEARDYKRRFGNSNEQMIEGDSRVNPANPERPYYRPGTQGQSVLNRYAGDYLNRGSRLGLGSVPRSQDEADRLYAAQLAANRNPIAALGFDQNRIVTTRPQFEPGEVNLNGGYIPGTDEIWWGGQSDTTPVHESFHRGIEALRKAGLLTRKGEKHEPYKEEYLVRRLMKNQYGPVEMDQSRALSVDKIDPALRASEDKNEAMDLYLKMITNHAHRELAKKIIEREGAVK